MRKEASHTKTSPASRLRLLPEIGLVDLADPLLPVRLAGKMDEHLELFASQMRHGLLAASVAIGLDVMGELIDAEVTEVAGPKGRHDKERAAYRHGSEEGKVTLGGRRIPVRRPRVRSVAGDGGVEREVHLESYDTFASVDLLADHMVASMLAGLSGRRYQRALEPVGEAVEADSSGTSQSTVSRRFIAATAERLAEFRSPPAGRPPLADRVRRRVRLRWAHDGRRPRRHRRWDQGAPRCGRGLDGERVGRARPDRLPARPRPRRQRGHLVRPRRRQGAGQGGA